MTVDLSTAKIELLDAHSLKISFSETAPSPQPPAPQILRRADRILIGPQGDVIAKGDGATDDYEAFQGSFDDAIQHRRPTIEVQTPPYRYSTSNTLHLGNGAEFHTVSVVADQASFDGHLPGVTIECTKPDRPTLNLQGLRRPKLTGLGFMGANYLHILGMGYGIPADDDPMPWVEPSLQDTALRPNAPYAAITIDGWRGGQVDYPAEAGAHLRGDLPSSDFVFQGLTIRGFGFGVATQPGRNADGNGDFLCLRDCEISQTVFPISISHTQARDLRVDRLLTNGFFAVLTNCRTGKGLGKIDGEITALTCSTGQKILDVPYANIAGTLRISGLYAEATRQIGRWGVFARFNGPLIIEGRLFSIDEAVVGGRAAGLVESGGESYIELASMGLSIPPNMPVTYGGGFEALLTRGTYRRDPAA
jgi:hypothetical protein